MGNSGKARKNGKTRSVAQMLNSGVSSASRVVADYNAAVLGKAKPACSLKKTSRSSS